MVAVLERHYTESVETKATAAYLGLAVGDALGATVEFMSPRQIQSRFGLHNAIIGGGWLGLQPGQVTDDTTMSLALGDAILKMRGIDSAAIAQAFSEWLVNEPVDVGNTVKRGIVHYRYTGTPYVPENVSDAGNGACMRTLPVALATYGLCDDVLITIASRDHAHVTHNNPLSDAATECVIRMIHAGLDGVDKASIEHSAIKKLLQQFPEFDYVGERREMPSGYIVETMQAVLQAFFATDSFEDCLVDVVNRGGDADTTGAIAGMIAGSYYGLAAIPEKWVANLDNAVRKACQSQAEALLMLDFSKK